MSKLLLKIQLYLPTSHYQQIILWEESQREGRRCTKVQNLTCSSMSSRRYFRMARYNGSLWQQDIKKFLVKRKRETPTTSKGTSQLKETSVTTARNSQGHRLRNLAWRDVKSYGENCQQLIVVVGLQAMVRVRTVTAVVNAMEVMIKRTPKVQALTWKT